LITGLALLGGDGSREGSANRDGARSLGDCVGVVDDPRALAFILSKRLRVGPAGGAAVTMASGCLGWTGCLESGCLGWTGCLESGCLGWTGCLESGCLSLARRDPPPGCLNVETIGFLLTEAGGDLYVVVLGVGENIWFSCSAGFVSTGPMLMFPANDGTIFLPSESPTILGTLLSDTVFEAIIASAVRFLVSPRGPGQPSQPSWVSRKSPSQVGYGAQVPSAVQMESMSGPV